MTLLRSGMDYTWSDSALSTHACAWDSDDTSASDSDSEHSDEDRIDISRDNADHLSDSTDHTSHLKDRIPVHKLNDHWKPTEHVPAIQRLCVSNLIKQCNSAFNTLDSNVMRMQNMGYLSINDHENAIKPMIVPVKEKTKMYTAALVSHVERRDAEITSLKKELLESELRCTEERTSLSERRNTTEVMEARNWSSHLSSSAQPIPCKHKEATPSVTPEGRSSQTGEYNMATQPLPSAEESLTQSLEFLQEDLEHQNKRTEQRKNALRALEHAKHIGEGERQAMQHNIQTLQEEGEWYKHTVAARDATMSASHDLIRRKNTENQALKKNERQQADSMELLRHAGVEKDRKLEALRNEGSEQAQGIESLQGTKALREKEYKDLEATVANRNTESVVLWRRIHELEGEAEAKPSNKRARVD